MCLHSATACTEWMRSSSPGSSRSDPHRNGWAPEGSPAPPVPLGPLFHLSPSSPFLCGLLFWLFSSPVTVFPCQSEATAQCHHASFQRLSWDCPCQKWQLMLKGHWITAEPNPTPAPLDWRGLPHLERGGPEPLGAPSYENTSLICCEHLVVNKGSWTFPSAKERSAEGFFDVSLKHRLQTDPLWGRAVLGCFQSGHILVFLPPSCGANCASGNSRSWECSGWAGAMVCF